MQYSYLDIYVSIYVDVFVFTPLVYIGRRKRARYSVDMDLCSDEDSSETVLTTPTRPPPLIAYIPPPAVEEPNPSALNAVIANTPIKRERY